MVYMRFSGALYLFGLVVVMAMQLPAAVHSGYHNPADTCTMFGKKGKLLYRDDFNAGPAQWVMEYGAAPGSSITVRNHALLIDVAGGATVWFRKKLSGNILITYSRKVLVNGGSNDRLSDFNQFWMATDPHSENLFTRKGTFSQYDSLLLYYAGIGGNTNTTTRFRKYMGTGERRLLAERNDNNHLLKANKTYTIQTAVYNGCTRLLVNGEIYFSWHDAVPLHEGYFGFRTTQSKQEITDFKVYRLE